MTTPNSTYAKPFLTVSEQIRRLRERGMDCGDDAYAADVLERYGYYRLSGYWHLYRERPVPPALRFDDDGREIRLDTFVSGTSLEHVVSLYEFDHELRMRLSDILSTIETAFRFFIGHRLGRVDAFAHRHPLALGATRQEDPGALARVWSKLTGRIASPRVVPTTAYREWLKEFDRHEKRARGDFVVHFRQQYGPHLPIWVATEVMSFGVLSSLYDLMLQSDQEILAARFQVHAADGRGDRGALGNWLNDLRNVRNICAHYGRTWNRAFDVTIAAPGKAQRNADDPLAPLADDGTNNRLYGVLLVMRHLLLSIAPERADVVELADFIGEQSLTIGFGMEQLGFPEGWRSSPIWYKVVIEIELGGTKFYPAFQFRDGKIIDALAEINKKFSDASPGADSARLAAALLDWWQTPHQDLPQDADGSDRSPLDLLNAVSEEAFAAAIDESNAMGSFAVSDRG